MISSVFSFSINRQNDVWHLTYLSLPTDSLPRKGKLSLTCLTRRSDHLPIPWAWIWHEYEHEYDRQTVAHLHLHSPQSNNPSLGPDSTACFLPTVLKFPRRLLALPPAPEIWARSFLGITSKCVGAWGEMSWMKRWSWQGFLCRDLAENCVAVRLGHLSIGNLVSHQGPSMSFLSSGHWGEQPWTLDPLVSTSHVLVCTTIHLALFWSLRQGLVSTCS